MHRSRLATFIIDCDEADFQRGVEFWSRALGREPMRREDPRYMSLRGRVGGEGGVYVGLQRVAAEGRTLHLDIESDDVEAEVARLVGLGARVKGRIRNHVVMLAPSGHAFCVVPVRRGDFDSNAVEWEEATR